MVQKAALLKLAVAGVVLSAVSKPKKKPSATQHNSTSPNPSPSTPDPDVVAANSTHPSDAKAYNTIAAAFLTPGIKYQQQAIAPGTVNVEVCYVYNGIRYPIASPSAFQNLLGYELNSTSFFVISQAEEDTIPRSSIVLNYSSDLPSIDMQIHQIMTVLDTHNEVKALHLSAQEKYDLLNAMIAKLVKIAPTPQQTFKTWILGSMLHSAAAYVSRGDNTQPLGDYSWVRFGSMYAGPPWGEGQKMYMQSNGEWHEGGSPVTNTFGEKIGRGTFGSMAAYIRWQYGTKTKAVGWQNTNDILNDVVKAAGVDSANQSGPVCSVLCTIWHSVDVGKVIDALAKLFKASQDDGGGDGLDSEDA